MNQNVRVLVIGSCLSFAVAHAQNQIPVGTVTFVAPMYIVQNAPVVAPGIINNSVITIEGSLECDLLVNNKQIIIKATGSLKCKKLMGSGTICREKGAHIDISDIRDGKIIEC
jgi:hypothetical protein